MPFPNPITLKLNMDDQDDQDDQEYLDEDYHDSLVHEHDNPLHHGHLTHDNAGPHANDNLFYNPEAHVPSNGMEYQNGYEDGNTEYEPPSPSYPYPEDQHQLDSELALDDLDPRHVSSRNPRHVSELYNDAVSGTDLEQGSSVISEYLRSKDPYWDSVHERTEPLNLLELPVDVLRLIVKEITHTNDLTSLALSNSTFHNLAIPHIYSRFDIVWPDAHTTNTEAKSVDALTYGLSTLCLGSPFARSTRRFRKRAQSTAGPLAKFVGNDYAKYTRKFSLGNGPNDWVSEYMINKESGKMLGTLVALAVAKMVNLETFIWDMPTGVLSDIFMALGSLPDSSESGECQLERVWVRWHDNSDAGVSSSSSSSPSPAGPHSAVVPAGSTLTPIGISLPSTAEHPPPKPTIPYSENHVEYPTFSVLPPLKCLTVLDIDELAYLDEISVLIERSVDILQELRIGISTKAIHHDFVQTWDGPELAQVDHDASWPGESSIGERRLGGILGVLVGRIYDIRRKTTKPKGGLVSAQQGDFADSPTPTATSATAPLSSDNEPAVLPESQSSPSTLGGTPIPVLDISLASRPASSVETACASASGNSPRARLTGKLKLTTLELERVPLSMQVCSQALDWSVLTNLTILECAQHENLWKLLKKQFLPQPQVSGYGISPTSSKPVPNAPLQYFLSLKRIHTDATSPALIAFIRETLAPNSLETLFLQDRRRISSAGSLPPLVTIETIFKGAIKRHRSSLRRLLLDSSAKNLPGGSSNADNTRWRSWCLPTEILQYITSGRMSSLKELSVAIDYKDWHTFLQRLPNVPQLRSLHIPYLADHVLSNPEPKELVMQMTDIITLRSEIQLCYVGISGKCFEILENRPSDLASGCHVHGNSGHSNGEDMASPVVIEDATDDDDTEDDEHDDDDSGDEGTPTSPTEPDETQSEHSYDGDSDDDSFVEPAAPSRLRLREILFYDDKVAIFKARHGRL